MPAPKKKTSKAKAKVKDLRAKKNPKGGNLSLQNASKISPVSNYNFTAAWPQK